MFYRSSKLILSNSSVIKRYNHKPCLNPCIKLSILGNMSPTARMLALLLKQCQGIDELRLYGKDEIVCNTAIDLAQVDTDTIVKAYRGGNAKLTESITGANIIVICGGYPILSHITQDELFEQNYTAVRSVVLHCVEYNPDAILLVATPPINSIIPMIAEEYKRENVYNPQKIIGVTSLSTVIANALIGKYLKYNPVHVHCPVIGGDSRQTRIPILSQCTPSLSKIPEDDRLALHTAIVHSENSCLDFKYQENLGPLYLSQSFAITRFISNLVSAMKGKQGIYECAYVRQTGHIDSFLPFMQSIVRLGCNGVEECYMPKISEWECDRLLKAYIHIKNDIYRGTSVVNGARVFSNRAKRHSKCDVYPRLRMRRNEHVGDVLIDFSQKYKDHIEVYTSQ